MVGVSGAQGQVRGPVIRRVCYDGGALSVTWNPVGDVAAGYRVTVFEGASPVAEADAESSGHVRFPVDLAPGSRHEVAVCAFGADGAPRGWSARVPAVADTVAVERVENDPVSGKPTLCWTAEEDEFLVRLDVGGAGTGAERPATGRTSTVSQLPPGAWAVASVAVVRRHDGAVSVGPYGTGLPVPTHRPALLAVRFAGERLHAEWTASAGAEAYRVSVLHGGHVLWQHTTTDAVTTSLDEPLEEPAGTAGGDGGRPACAVVVQALGAAGSGPPSAPLPVLFTAPRVTAVRSDGRTLSVDVTPPPGLVPTGYDLALLRDGVPVRTAAPGAASTLSLPVPDVVVAEAVYTVSVRARAGRSAGPAATAPALLTAPRVSSVVCGTGLTVTATTATHTSDRPMEALLRTGTGSAASRRLDADGRAVFPVPAPAHAVTVAVRAVDGVAAGPWSEPVPVPTGRVGFTAVEVGADRVALAWDGREGATFRVTAGRSGVVTTGMGAELPLEPGAATATVAEVDGAATGPVTSVTLFTDPVRITRAAVDAGRRVTLTWAGATRPPLTGLQPVVRWADNTVPLDVMRVSNPLVVMLPDEVPNAATVALRGVSLAGSGPLGNAVTLLTVAPAALEVAYDGAAVAAAWEPVGAPATDRYVVVVSRPDAPDVVVTTAEPRARVELPAGAALSAPTLTVAAMAGGLARGLPTAPVPLLTEALFPGPSSIAPRHGPASGPADITLCLPELFATPQSGALNLPLGLTLAPARSAPYAYVLEIPGNSPLWDFTVRDDVVPQWTSLLAGLEQRGITSYGVAALGEAVSRAVPQTFAESLYFAYGLRFDRGCFDLRPGVVVRVEYEGYQVAPGQQANALSGYVTTAVADYEVTSGDRSGRWSAGLDAFLNALTQAGVTVPPPVPPGPGQAYGGGGLLDLFTPTVQLPYTRVVYPPESLQTTSPGSLLPQQNVLFLAGATLGSLDAATDNVRRRGAPGPGVAAAYLRGRAVVRPMVRIWVDGAQRLVALGTTLGDVLAGAARRPPSSALPLTGVTLRRARAAAVPPGDRPCDWRVAVDWAGLDPGVLDLPLLHGDRVGLGTAG
ncbi:hypothetical protein [Streptomyces sp. NPDC021224]|uniref:hypothetical protein n=1 Tax=unclassified Streptomyces TaxID=2593676 RepID=UPI0037AC9E56